MLRHSLPLLPGHLVTGLSSPTFAVNHTLMCTPEITAAGGTQAPVTGGRLRVLALRPPYIHVHVE